MPTYELFEGDCLDVMKDLPDNSIDSVICDPPYNLSFMGKKWDTVSNFQTWCEEWSAECLRVLKPGGYLLAFGGTRTYHRLASGIEDAGFEITDSLMYLYGSGMPKGLNVSKAIDKKLGVERPVIGPDPEAGRRNKKQRDEGVLSNIDTWTGAEEVPVTGPGSEDAKKWNGFNTQLKPAFEPIVIGRKPFKGTFVDNILEHGTGALNIDACRIGTTKDVPASISKHEAREDGVYEGNRDGSWSNETGGAGSGHDPNTGRYPANVILDEVAGEILDEQAGPRKSGGSVTGNEPSNVTDTVYGEFNSRVPFTGYQDSEVGPSRFFYTSKVSKKERQLGMPEGVSNKHPTLKPINLLRYLAKLVTQPNGTILDPFMGSGSMGMAALQEGFSYTGIEKEPEYVEIANHRVSHIYQTLQNDQ